MASQPEPMRVEELNYTPHPDLIIKEGQTHFDSISDSICEHIDNSITASVDNPPAAGRKIEVQIYAPRSVDREEPMYLLVWDNAGGMNSEQLQAYFTVAEGREARGLDPVKKPVLNLKQPHLTGTLSKFGVGALQSFAYLGDALKVITKYHGDNDVRSYKIDKALLKKKTEEGGREGAYRGQTYIYKSAVDALDAEERRKELVAQITEWDKLPHFTAILIRLKDFHKPELFRNEALELVDDLANIYYYYIQPEHMPSFTDRHKRPLNDRIALGAGRHGKSAKTKAGQSAGSASATSLAASSRPSSTSPIDPETAVGLPVELGVSFCREGAKRFPRTNLRDHLQHCMEGKFRSACVDTWTSTFEIDDPNSLARDNLSDLTLQKTTEVNVVARYYPFRGYEETRPSMYEQARWLAGDDENDTSDDDSAHVERSEAIVDVRWIGRKLPKAMYNRLWFFPPERKNANAAHLRDFGKWRSRIHVTLFIRDWNFPVANNKLSVQGQFERMLQDGKRCKSVERDLQTSFHEWLKTCHKQYDVETSFEQAVAKPPVGAARAGFRYFLAVRYGAGSGDTWKAGDVVLFSLTKTQGTGKKKRTKGFNSTLIDMSGGAGNSSSGAGGGSGSSNKRDEEVLGKILYFETDAPAPGEEATMGVGPRSRFYYMTLPEEVFGSDVLSVQSATAGVLDPKRSKLEGAELDKALKERKDMLVKSLKLHFWDSEHVTSRAPFPASVTWTETEGQHEYQNMLVELLDGRKQPITDASSVVPRMYNVKVEFKMGTRDKAPDPIVITKSSEINLKDWPFKMPELPVGRHGITISVLDARPGKNNAVVLGPVAQWRVSVTQAPPGEPVQWELEGLFGSRLQYAEEMALSAFSLRLEDKHQRATGCQEVTVEVEVPGCSVEYRGGSDGSSMESASPKKRRKGMAAAAAAATAGTKVVKMAVGEGGVSFDAGSWVMVREGAGPLLSNEWAQPQPLQCTVIVNAGQGIQDSRKEGVITVDPGVPASLVLVEPALPQPTAAGSADTATTDGGFIPVPNGSQLPTIRLRVLDAGDNVTGPRSGEKWSVLLQCDDEGVQLRQPAERHSGWPVAGTGEVVIDGASLDVAFEKGHEGQRRVSLDLNLITGRGANAIKLTKTLQLEVQARKGVPAEAELHFTVVSVAGQALQPGEQQVVVKASSSVQRVEAPVGALIKQARVVFFDELGTPIAPGTVSTVKLTASWVERKTLPGDQDLPDTKVPESAAVKPRLRVEASFVGVGNGKAEQKPFVMEAELRPQPGVPKNVWFDHALAMDVQAGVAFARDTAAIAFRDMYKNPVDARLHPNLPVPQVEWAVADAKVGGQITMDPPGPLPTTLDAKTGHYKLSQTVTITGRAQRIKVRVLAQGFQSMKTELSLLPGPAGVLQVAVPPHGVPNFGKGAEVRLTRGEELRGLVVQLLDASGHNAAKVTSPIQVVAYLASLDVNRTGRSTAAKNSTPSVLSSVTLEAKARTEKVELPSFVFNDRVDRTLVLEAREEKKKGAAATVLCSAEVGIKFYTVNRVTNLLLSLGEARVAPAATDARRSGRAGATPPAAGVTFVPTDGPFTVDSGPPIVAVVLETEDDQALDPKPETLTMRVEKEGAGRGSRVIRWYNAAELAVRSTDNKSVAVFRPGDSAGVKVDVGHYTVTMTYKEQREQILRLSTSTSSPVTVTKTYSFSIVPGAAAAIEAADELQNATLSANNRTDRLLARDVRLRPVDSAGRPTRHTEQMFVAISGPSKAGEPHGATPAPEGPTLQGCDNVGRVSAEAKVEGGLTVYTFKQLELKKDSGTVAGTYRLVFECQGLKSWSIPFAFVSEAGRMKAIRELQDQLDKLRKEHVPWKREKDSLDRRVQELTHARGGILRDLQAYFRDAKVEMTEVEARKRSVETEIKAREEANYAESLKPPHYPPSLPGVQADRAIVDIGLVADRSMALLLSWYAGSRMLKAIVVETNEDYKKVKAQLRTPPPVFSKEDVSRFTGQHNVKQKKLELAAVTQPGFIGYAVNVVQLRPEDEPYRSTVFWEIFGNTMIFETEDHALNYRKTRSQNRPTILTTKDKRRIAGRGPLDANDKMHPHHKLEFVFGSPKPTETDEHRQLQSQVRAMELLLENLKEETDCSKRKKAMEEDEAAKARLRKIQELDAEYQKLSRKNSL